MKTKKKLAILTIVIFSILLGYCVIWYLTIGMKYSQWMKSVDKIDDQGLISYEKVYDDYYLKIKPTVFCSYSSGFLSIATAGSTVAFIDEEGNVTPDTETFIQIFIWLKPINKYDVGVAIVDGEITYSIMLDKDFNITNYPEDYDGYENIKSVLNKNKDKVMDMMSVVEEVWGIHYFN